MQFFQRRIFKTLLFLSFLLFFSLPGKAEDLLLEPVIQKYAVPGIVHTIKKGNSYYIDAVEMADALQMQMEESHNKISFSFLGKKHDYDLMKLPENTFLDVDGQLYFSPYFYENNFPLRLLVSPLDMQLIIDSDETLPVVQKYERERRQSNFIPLKGTDPYSNYTFDDRLFATPVVDFSYHKNFSVQDYNQHNQNTFNSDTYQIDSGFLFAGLDTFLSVFGNSEQDDYAPRARLTMGRTLLEEPKNPFNLTTFEMGDIQSFNNTLFSTGSQGRGAAVSSFKDLVLSADKTIDITGPLSDGWEVELYLNNQLIGFRRQSVNGRYEFKNVPVGYGLNAFKVVFYGPYGEVRSEDRHYYSGTSPVKSGEFGYTADVFQKDRYLFESNEPFKSDSDAISAEVTGYYGLTDWVTLMAGYTRMNEHLTDKEQNFFHAGAQLIFAGASFQYNLMNNASNKKIGHHVEVQGNIYIGDIFARYDYFDGMESPTSYYQGRYLKNQFEGRLTGNIPFAMNLPYYVSYKESQDHTGWKAQEIQTRLSPNFMRYYNFSIENTYYKDDNYERNLFLFLLQAQYGKFGAYAQAIYQVDPDPYLQNTGLKFDYRWDRNTYAQIDWTHSYKNDGAQQKEIDVFTIGASRLFPFGGLQLSLGGDTKNNYSASLTYNISFGKTPDKNEVFTDSRTIMSENAAIHVVALDEDGTLMPNVRFYITSWESSFTTGEDGSVLISDLQPYQKTVLRVDMNSIDDFSLIPDFTEKKLVLRPGTVLPVECRFTHKGDLEGLIINNNRPYLYKVSLLDQAGDVTASKMPAKDGSFIIEGISFGTYELIVQNKKGDIIHRQNITIDKSFTGLENAILVQ